MHATLKILPILLIAACVPVSKVSDQLSRLQPKPAEKATPTTLEEMATFAPAGYARLLNDRPYGFRFSVPGEPVRRGQRSERYEVRSADCAGTDCGNPRYRSEIRSTGDARTFLRDDTWFGWSFYNANIPSFSRRDALKTVYGQWKLDGSIPAAIRVIQIGQGEGNWTTCDPAVCQRTQDAGRDVVLQLDDMRQANNWGEAQNDGYICKLFSMEASRGTWVDLVINSNFAPDHTGFVRAWVNGDLVCNYQGAVAPTQPKTRSADPNHRRGIYVSYTTRWDTARKGAPRPTMVAYYDEYLSGTKREDVDTRLRIAANKPPVD
ncbi:heparin lyase I family protein [Pseudoprimorskyibacter insulae]|uniref:Uncharacterized protein n=1 Tax=Pseudoprimorskyibacter insulae TaxID=1695997 RepID=A0A2R8AQ71_9RHOB|nr:heparin lyase I family protein [Pseudoprimorskyibacter insulae]SPF77984.1 hypothetical protein PRI8871_00573 [Pseudoprimorskyibacter insulae]